MSSVVNKGSTRFVPKIKQRRVVQPTESKPEAIVKPNESQQEQTQTPELAQKEESESSGPSRSISPFSKDGPLDATNDNNNKPTSETHSTKEARASKDITATASSVPVDDGSTLQAQPQSQQQPQPHQHRASVRLDSISSQRRMSIGGRLSGTTLGLQNQQGRLMTMSKKNPQLMSANNDRQLQAMKRRRLSSTSQKTSVGYVKKSQTPAKRISIISRTSTSSENGSEKSRDPSVEDMEALELEKYRVSKISDIPNELTETEGIKYHIDDSTFTMAELCKPVLPIGEISDNYHIAQAATLKKHEEKKKKRALRKLAREQFKPLKLLTKEDDDLQFEQRKLKQQELMNADVPEAQAPQQAPQLIIGADGNIIIDEESTIINRHANANLVNMHKERQDENTFANLYNTSTYSKREYTDPWTPDEEVKLYKSLSMWGTDFNLISQLFPYRTRRQVKLKFTLEERKHPVLVELALRRKLPPDFEKFCVDIKKDIGTIEEFNLKLGELKTKHDEHLKQIQIEKDSAKEEDNKRIQDHIQNGGTGPVVLGSLDDRKVAGGYRESDLKSYRKTEIVLGTIDDMKKPANDSEAAA